MRRRDLLALGLSSLSLAALGGPFATAQGRFPEGPIKLIVPRAAGGVVDVVGRFWGEQVRSLLGNVVIENQGGGGGIIAATAVARAKPDGHTLLAGTTSELVISPATATVSYDPEKMAGLAMISLYDPKAGARNAIVSLWPVDDAVTCVLMERLADGIAGGATIAEALTGDFSVEEVWRVLQHTPIRDQAAIFEYFPIDMQVKLAEGTGRPHMARLIEQMSHDDRVALLRRLSPRVAENLLRLVDEADRRDIATLRKFPVNTVGALMTTDYAWLPVNITVDEALERLRKQEAELQAQTAKFRQQIAERTGAMAAEVERLKRAKHDCPDPNERAQLADQLGRAERDYARDLPPRLVR